jgi:hypothetical protein
MNRKECKVGNTAVGHAVATVTKTEQSTNTLRTYRHSSAQQTMANSRPVFVFPVDTCITEAEKFMLCDK